MLSRRLTVLNESGIHARPASNLVRFASGFKSSITIILNNKTANAKSLLNVLALGCIKGSQITIEVTGNDEAEAIDQLADFIVNLKG